MKHNLPGSIAVSGNNLPVVIGRDFQYNTKTYLVDSTPIVYKNREGSKWTFYASDGDSKVIFEVPTIREVDGDSIMLNSDWIAIFNPPVKPKTKGRKPKVKKEEPSAQIEIIEYKYQLKVEFDEDYQMENIYISFQDNEYLLLLSYLKKIAKMVEPKLEAKGIFASFCDVLDNTKIERELETIEIGERYPTKFDNSRVCRITVWDNFKELDRMILANKLRRELSNSILANFDSFSEDFNFGKYKELGENQYVDQYGNIQFKLNTEFGTQGRVGHIGDFGDPAVVTISYEPKSFFDKLKEFFGV